MLGRFVVGVVVAFAIAFSGSAAAQGGSRRRAAAEERVRELGRQAKQAYTELDIERARALFKRALAKGTDAKVSSVLLSQLWVDLGVVEVAGFAANDEGRTAFRNALRLNAKIRPDPLATTPEVQAIFEEALRAAGLVGAAPPAREPKTAGAPVAPATAPREAPRSAPVSPPVVEDEPASCEGADCASERPICVGAACAAEDRHGTAPGATPASRGLFFVQVGAVVGAAYVKQGMRADSDRPAEFSATQPGPWVDCNDSGEDCNVRIEAAGVTPTFALRALAGLQLTPRFSTGLSLRFQPSAGVGPLAHWLTGVHARYTVGALSERGFYTNVQGGLHYGQVQPRPPQDDTEDGPFVRSGKLGVSAGADVGYRLSGPVALVFSPTALVLFGDFLFNMDFVGGIELSF